MNPFDLTILHFFNQFALKSPTLDAVIISVADSHALKGLVVVSLLWWVWFIPGKYSRQSKEIVIASMVAGFFSLLIGRLLGSLLPFRQRPLYEAALQMQFPFADPDRFLRTWSSFPSDHAMLWFSIATGIFLASRRIGVFALVYTTTVICVPRLYLGFHYPTDIVTGGILGILLTWIANTSPLRSRVAAPALSWEKHHPQSFYACAFLLSINVATHFEGLREVAKDFLKAMSA